MSPTEASVRRSEAPPTRPPRGVSSASAEAKFYKDHYAGGVGVGATPLDVFAREMLAPGKRYGLVAEHLYRDGGAGGCLAEIGCGGGEALLILSESRHFDRIIGVDIALVPECQRQHGCLR